MGQLKSVLMQGLMLYAGYFGSRLLSGVIKKYVTGTWGAKQTGAIAQYVVPVLPQAVAFRRGAVPGPAAHQEGRPAQQGPDGRDVPAHRHHHEQLRAAEARHVGDGPARWLQRPSATP